MNDQQIRDRALCTKQSVIVQAPAGSGKTTLLISRFICLLAEVEQPEEVLAITFTRKATAEMRERVLLALETNGNASIEKCIANCSTSAQSECNIADAPFKQCIANRALLEVRKRAENHGWNLHEQPARLQIMTIDALAMNLIRRMPWASKFGSVPSLLDNQDDAYTSAAINTLESWNSETESEFGRAMKLLHVQLNNKSENILSLIEEMLKKRDQWRRLFQRPSFNAEHGNEVEETWQRLIEKFLKDIWQLLPDYSKEQFQDIYGLDKSEVYKASSLNFWREYAVNMRTTQHNWRTQGFSNNLSKNLDSQSWKELVKNCRDVDGLDSSLDFVSNLPNPQYQSGQWNVLRAILTVLERAIGELNVEFGKRGQVDFIEVVERASLALGSDENLTDLLFVVGYSYSHILVDEFQDTSVSHYGLLKKLTQGWEPNDGRTLFLVGDPMQSIYRFREAEVGNFLKAQQENEFGRLKLIPLQISQNFRSSKELVDWFNSTFEDSFPKKSDHTTGQVEYAPSVSKRISNNSKSINVWFQSDKDQVEKSVDNEEKRQQPAIVDNEELRQQQAKKLVSDLKNFLERNPESNPQAAILVSSRSHAKDIVPLLKEENIKFYDAGLRKLDEKAVVMDLLSLTRALLNMADRVSWFAILRAPWCGLSLGDMLVISKCRHELVWDSINDDSVLVNLSDDGGGRIRRLREVLQNAFAVQGRYDVRNWIQDSWTLLGGPVCGSIQDAQDAQKFLDLIEKYARGTGVENLHRFEDYLKDLYSSPEHAIDDVSVHISTIHNAKGLEYDAVFIPGLDRQPPPGSKPLLVWSEFLLEESDSKLLVAPISPVNQKGDDPMFEFINGKWNKKKDYEENTRLAYVACTRAKSELYLYGEKHYGQSEGGSKLIAPAKNTVMHRIYEGVVKNYSIPVIYHKTQTHNQPESSDADSKVFKIERLKSGWIIPETPSSLELPSTQRESPGSNKSIDFDWAGSVAIWVGNVVHQWLEQFVKTGLKNWNADLLDKERPKWREALRSYGLGDDDEEMDGALDRIHTALNNPLNDKTGRWLLDSQHQNSEAELRLTGYLDGQFQNVIIDRTFIDQDNVRWIVDYKTGAHSGSDIDKFLDDEVKRYRDQLFRYRDILSGIEDRPIKLGLYFPMFPEWREVNDRE